MTVHIEGLGVGSYDPGRGDTLLLSAELTGGGGGVREQSVRATPEQADYAYRVLRLLKPYFPTDEISRCAEEFLATLKDRAEQHVWCIRADNNRMIAHAQVSEYTTSEFENAVEAILPENIGINEDYDEDEEGEWDEDLESRVTIERVHESEIPGNIKIIGAAWA
ncbi:MAG: hypothetical protein ACRC20_12285 [Segniliparus sp.]|uniref:hypothetical protein n=1 Tax=Segniliparus sp. TaxID=2804064 RepID=UPI003F37EDFF